MKKQNYTYFLVGLIMLLISSCSSSKKIEQVSSSNVITPPLSGKEYQTDKDFFRAKQTGKSPDLATAKKIALLNAKTEMASNIQSVIKSVTDQYTNQRTVSNTQEFENKFEEFTREVVNQQLIDVKIIGEQIIQDKDKAYNYWLAIEASKETILNGVEKKISDDKKLQLDFDKFQFEKIYNAEMEKFEKQNK